MRVMVLGGTGCGGRAVVREARARGHTAWAVARGLRGRADVVCDRHGPELWAVVRGLSPDVFVDHVASGPDDVRDVLAVLPPACRYLLVSSAVVCGPARTTPYAPDEPPAPATPYAEAKRAAEALALARPGSRVLRLAALFGPGHEPITPWGRDPELANRLRAGEPLPVPDGARVQPWFAADHGAAVVDACESDGAEQVVHLAGPATTWAGWLEAWATAAGARAARLERVGDAELAARVDPNVRPFLDALLHPPLLETRGLAPATPLVDACRRTLSALDGSAHECEHAH